MLWKDLLRYLRLSRKLFWVSRNYWEGHHLELPGAMSGMQRMRSLEVALLHCSAMAMEERLTFDISVSQITSPMVYTDV